MTQTSPARVNKLSSRAVWNGAPKSLSSQMKVQRKFVNPSTHSPGLKTKPKPRAKFRAYETNVCIIALPGELPCIPERDCHKEKTPPRLTQFFAHQSRDLSDLQRTPAPSKPPRRTRSGPIVPAECQNRFSLIHPTLT